MSTFKLKDSARISLAVALAFPVAAHAVPAGRVDFVTGPVTALSSDGRSRPLTKGSEVTAGETIQTGNGRAQLRYSDGAQVSLQPGTQYRIDDYAYAGQTDGSEKGIFSLIKGGFRTITGLIGRVNRQNYKVSTPVATIGIRGTEFLVQSDENGVRVSTGEGLVEVCTKGGCIVLASGEQAVVLDAENKPVRVLNQGGGSTNEPPTETPSVAMDKPKEDYASASALQGYAFAVAGVSGSSTSAYASGSATIDLATGTLTQYVADGSNNAYFGLIQDQVGTDGIISWGVWAASSHAPGGSNPVSDTYTHYVTGSAAPPAAMAGLGTQNYTMIAATSPSIVNAAGAMTTGTAPTSGSLTAYFSSGTVDVNLSGGTPGSIYATGLPISGSTFAGSGTACCVANTSLSGIFTGANAERAGVVYQYSAGGSKVNGAAVFSPGGT